MPITTQISMNALDQEDFASKNELDRLCEEHIYQNDLTARLLAAGLPAQSEVPVKVTYHDKEESVRKMESERWTDG